MTRTRAVLFAISCVILALAACSGCNTGDMLCLKVESSDLVAQIEQAKIDLTILKEKALAAIAAADANPTKENIKRAELAVEALREKARATARIMVALENLIFRSAQDDQPKQEDQGPG